jgi:ribosomal protein L7/L12
MDNIILGVCIVIIILMIVGGVVILKDQTAPITGPPKKPLPDSQKEQALTSSQEEEILNLLSEQKKIGAIKLVVDYTGLGLTEAKNLVEELTSEANPTIIDTVAARTKVEALLRNGKKLEAISEWRTATGLSLADAKKQVDEMQQQLKS